MDTWFGAVVLLVCALASRFSDDPRVVVDGYDSRLSAGWIYYAQVQTLPLLKDTFSTPTLLDLQFYCLATQFLLTGSTPHLAIQTIALGLRCAEDIGAHRRTPPAKVTAEREMKKRAFWTLIYFDRLTCSLCGRSCIMRDTDYDAELPVECDDEYWLITDTRVEYKQPPNKPSIISAFCRILTLSDIMFSTSQTLYPCRRPKLEKGSHVREWERQIVSELDSRLNGWKDGIPEHLLWDPNREEGIFKIQSAFLHTMYYTVQIQLHRPFVYKPSPLSFSAVAITANAARSCIQIVERQAVADITVPIILMLAYFSGGILLLNLWKANTSGLPVSTTRERAHIEKCMRALKMYEDRWLVVGRIWDMLNSLSASDDSSTSSNAPTESSDPQKFVAVPPFSSEPLENMFSNSWQQPDIPGPTNSLYFGSYDEAQTGFVYSDLDSEMLDIWSMAPVGFDLEEWGTHIAQNYSYLG